MVPYTGFTAHPEDLRWGLLASSILDTVLCRNPALRYHTFIPERLVGVDVGVLDHGSGDELLCLLDARHGCLIKGFDHESPMSPHVRDEFRAWPGVLDEAPRELLAHLAEPEFRREETTFCIWRGRTDKCWWRGEVQEPDEGEWSATLLDHIFLDAGAYLSWAREHYSRKDVPSGPVEAVYGSCRIDEATVRAINPKADSDMVSRELAAMGVPLT
ncbi:Uncharacterized protein OS=Paenibacillus sp. MSt1 GN=ET33_35835 PE=4 SV=1 [Gemmata massiliana]|uniref:Uncharacterized protein n=1 Tax=Gemmata massiliana TaxID=1210884 RepID=A0A6P2DLS8_9BACT|nr:hypothetical protein [Gemmata massiliana]VTS03444.1 Uncharacterized protein OS=Paenibacillus sp. MSt1 GN=ET33_35835 PE=4 SV=1 [Gemmata massiliana]